MLFEQVLCLQLAYNCVHVLPGTQGEQQRYCQNVT